MKQLVILLLCLESLNSTGQSYRKCMVYLGDTVYSDKGLLLSEIQYFNDKGQLTLSKMLCRNKADSSCLRAINRNTYNDKGLIVDSTMILSKGDTIITRFFYNTDAKLDSTVAIYAHASKARNEVAKEEKYFYYNRSGDLIKYLRKETFTNGNSFCSKNVYHYKKDMKGTFVEQIIDTNVSTDGSFHHDVKADSMKWYAPQITITNYTPVGYISLFYKADDPDTKDTSIVEYTKDREARVVSEYFRYKTVKASAHYIYNQRQYMLNKTFSFQETFSEKYVYRYE